METEVLAPPELAFASSELFEQHIYEITGIFPEWLIDRKRAAWQRYLQLPMPHRKDEHWRFSSVRELDLSAFNPAQNAMPEELTSPLPDGLIQNAAAVLSFVNDELVHENPLSQELQDKGIIFCSLKEALWEYGDLVQSIIFQRHPDIGSEKFQALHEAFFKNGVFVYVPDGITLEQPLFIHHQTGTTASTILPHTLIATGENARVAISEIFTSQNAAAHNLVIGAADVSAGKHAKVDYNMIQNWNQNTLAFHLNSATADESAKLKTVTINIGGKQIRNEQHCRIIGPQSHVDMDSLGVVNAAQELDQRTLQTHSAPEATSDLLYKNALLDDARTIFSGLIIVDPIAQKTDAYQTNRNLLLSPNAEANSLPGLEILANDVKCSHGATTSELDASELFYFLARGIPRADAQQLLIFGFFEEIIGKLDNDPLADYVRELINQKLDS
jgi:Fe-S cluster assembly protein SufD